MADPTHSIRCLVPDLPSTSDLLPYLAQIDAERWYSNFGPLARSFEDGVRESIERAVPGRLLHVLSCASGTAALEAAISAYNLPRATRVLMPALTFPATAQAVLRCGHEPVFADVCPERWQLTPRIAARVLRRNDIGFVMPVATYGRPVPQDRWDHFTACTNVPVLIDAAAAFGAQGVGRTTSVAFSFHATKPFGIGEGGAFVTADRGRMRRARSFTNFGFHDTAVEMIGTNGKLSEYHAAVGLAQLERWSAVRERRQHVWDTYRTWLDAMPDVVRQAGHEDDALALLVVLLPCAAAPVAEALAVDGIQTRKWYVPPLHEHPAMATCARAGALDVVEGMTPRLLGLPFHTRLDDADVAFVCQRLETAIVHTMRAQRIAS